ncbi:MAG TPA: class I SAM-dependent methyltransferase [Bacteroidales bacterium]|jgi:predicted O-methyltransferase YrrM|nr:class I SAM-dependent methyltransferase [Bacteroidales bacterium]
MNTFLATHILRYALLARHKRGHGIHSPYVYNLIRSVFIDTTEYSEYALIEAERKKLLHNSDFISVVDLGAGSHSLQTKYRKISDIASSSVSPRKYAQLLYRLIRYSGASRILELGTSLGISGTYMALANTKARCISLEGDNQIAAIARNTAANCKCTNVDIRVGHFNETLTTALQDLGEVDFVFIDGNHQKQATVEYFETILPYCNEHTILVFDDIYWSLGMMEAWEYIQACEQVSISIDICKLGLIFFRKGIIKQHFVIRY